MIEFQKMTDDELQQFAESHSDGGRSRRIGEAFKEELLSVNKKLQTAQNDILKIEESICKKKYDVAYEKCHKIAIMLSKLSSILNVLPGKYGEKDTMKKVRRDYIEKKDVLFQKDETCLKIILPELLPHKQQYDVSTQKMRYYYDIDTFRASYYDIFSKEFINGKFKILNEKVVIWYKHHFKDLKKAPDPDGIDTKPMTDLIALFILVDDSFPYCSQLVTAVEDKEREYTEIIICPEKDVLKEPSQ